MTNQSNRWRVGIFVVGTLAVLAAFVLARHVEYREANLSETRMVLSDVSGADIEVVYTNSDTLAKQEDMSVYISSANRSRSWISRRLRRKTLLFRYDPGSPVNPLPSITSPTHGHVLISVPRVSSVSLQRTQWEGISVAYNIGRIDYP